MNFVGNGLDRSVEMRLYNMELPKRKLPRLNGYNYANEGYYFVTICTKNKQQLLWDIYDGTVKSVPYNDIGIIVKNELINITSHFNDVKIDKYVIMPNHIHCIVIIGCCGETERSRPFPTLSTTLSTVIGLYKSGVSKIVHKIYPYIKIWQTSFHDHIIRNENEYQRIWNYIDENPQKWAKDCYFV